ncbi:MAG: hypothetical protein M1838_003610 [Thelocarpon superellum]|nr:MAG: hypothetical protein M1838_003610 [Thelocarpon superellum]
MAVVHPQLHGHLEPSTARPHLDPSKIGFKAPSYPLRDTDLHNAPKPAVPLEQYQALGCLRIWLRRATVRQGLRYCDEWQEASSAGDVLPIDHDCVECLSTLLRVSLARIMIKRNDRDREWGVIRIYVLPDDVGPIRLDRNHKRLRAATSLVLRLVDASPSVWSGSFDPRMLNTRLQPDRGESVSLFYMFNTLRSPQPDPMAVADQECKKVMHDLLGGDGADYGIKAKLYPHQRRSAAMMLQKEVAPSLRVDPECRSNVAPDGSGYYFDPDHIKIVRHPVRYYGARGGILAETMGLGKTLICLALVSASRDQWPKVPPEYANSEPPRRVTTGSLLDMSAAAITRHARPSRRFFDRLQQQEGIDPTRYHALIKEHGVSYTIPPPPRFYAPRSILPDKGRQVYLSTGTIIVCPANLVQHWMSEIKKHCEEGGLNILVMANHLTQLPPLPQLLEYDIILFSRARFEREARHGVDNFGKDSPNVSKQNCPCDNLACTGFHVDRVYQSPLTKIHFKRVLVDEGHYCGGGSRFSNANVVANLIIAERRWVVSGTPANGLIGTEVELAALPTNQGGKNSPKASMQDILERRKTEHLAVQERKDLERIGRILKSFLKLRPWATPRGEASVSWNRSMKPTNEDGHWCQHFSLRSILEDVVIKHLPGDTAVALPPLSNRIVHLDPCYYDRLSINLFLTTLAANAITSEREDGDYLFHPKNRKALNGLVNNLRQSGFYWTGFSIQDVTATMDVSKAYLAKSGSKCTSRDRALLREAIGIGERAVGDKEWGCFNQYQELGILVQDFPERAREMWALNGVDTNPTLVGLSQLSLAQKEVSSQLYASDPAAHLPAAGILAMTAAKQHGTEKQAIQRRANPAGLTVLRSPDGVSSLKRTGHAHPSKSKRKLSQVDSSDAVLKSAMKVVAAQPEATLPADSSLRATRIVAVASAKLAYLLDQIQIFHRAEKILVAYEGDHIAYYISQALDIVGVKHLIYANTLAPERRAQYIVTFNTTETFRVLLMDVHQAAHGLNLSSASRVFFVNPIWQPNIEAQAVKRAHRIGQTRPVYVETLVLRDTLEDQMLQRRGTMGHDEHEKTRESLLDDAVMSSIIQNATFLPLTKDIVPTHGQMALLIAPQQVFGRASRSSAVALDPDEGLVEVTDPSGGVTKAKRSRRQLEISGVAEPPGPANTLPVASPSASEDLQSTDRRRKVKKRARFMIEDEDEDEGETEVDRGEMEKEAPDHLAPSLRVVHRLKKKVKGHWGEKVKDTHHVSLFGGEGAGTGAGAGTGGGTFFPKRNG